MTQENVSKKSLKRTRQETVDPPLKKLHAEAEEVVAEAATLIASDPTPEALEADDASSSQENAEKLESEQVVNLKDTLWCFTIENLSLYYGTYDAIPPPGQITKHLILDLDDTLITYRHRIPSCPRFLVQVEYDEYDITVRPHLDDFLTEMSKYFHLHIYTSAGEEYAYQVLQEINWENLICQPYFTRSHCDFVGGVKVKTLSRAVKDIYNSDSNGHEDLESFTRKTVLLLDDDPFYAVESNYNNVLTAPKFTATGDDFLLKVMGLLKFIAVAESVEEAVSQLKAKWLKEGAVAKTEDPHK